MKKRVNMKLLRIAAAAALTGLCLLLVGFFVFLNIISKVAAPDYRQSQAIIVLTGGSERIPAGLELLRFGYAPELFISGVLPGNNVDMLLQDSGLSEQETEWIMPHVNMGFAANSTRTNALEVAQWLSKRNYTTIRLVTSNYHMPRSILELKSRMPNLTIIPHPVAPPAVKITDWWQYWGTTKLLVVEYVKFAAVWLREAFWPW